MASSERGCFGLRDHLEEVSSFLDEVKKSRSHATLVSRITGLEKLFKERDQDAHHMELKSETSYFII